MHTAYNHPHLSVIRGINNYGFYKRLFDKNLFNLLKPRADGFRNYCEKPFAVSTEEMMLDKAQLLGLTPVEMTGILNTGSTITVLGTALDAALSDLMGSVSDMTIGNGEMGAIQFVASA